MNRSNTDLLRGVYGQKDKLKGQSVHSDIKRDGANLSILNKIYPLPQQKLNYTLPDIPVS